MLVSILFALIVCIGGSSRSDIRIHIVFFLMSYQHIGSILPCPSCRTTLDSKCPAIPNFTVLNVVTKHIQVLTANRMDGWAPGSTNVIEREERTKYVIFLVENRFN